MIARCLAPLLLFAGLAHAEDDEPTHDVAQAAKEDDSCAGHHHPTDAAPSKADDPHAGHGARALPAKTAIAPRDAHVAHVAHADHAGHADHADHAASALGGHGHGGGSSLSASVGVLVADYDARLFTGAYQAVVAGLRWSSGRFGLAASVPVYRLTKNGKTVDGTGDVMVHGHVSLVGRGPWSAGAMMMASAPTGDGDAGLGMGHAMLMPEAWGGWTSRRVALTTSLGLGYAVGGLAAHAAHGGGMWPLVDPMNAMELTYGAGVMLGLARELGVGARLRGAMPIGDGAQRLVGAVRVVWVAGRAQTALEIQHGTVGDPFGLRGVLETAIRLR
ncbi:MAG: hypothetical protein KF773_27015 [Deltaproteobacteria bacterium]|nr:hypothetical protein [Deltaproteobacteria bacterium]MCW5802520.1 hypothetical protein [Deltaproteobacteria bacterium]